MSYGGNIWDPSHGVAGPGAYIIISIIIIIHVSIHIIYIYIITHVSIHIILHTKCMYNHIIYIYIVIYIHICNDTYIYII